MDIRELTKIWNATVQAGKRLETREVRIGSLPMGGGHPVRIQSMTNTPTLDTEASVDQCIRLAAAGADYIRLTAQSIREAENLSRIRENLRSQGLETPLIADTHFNPAIAEKAAQLVEKIRINPGNFVRIRGGVPDRAALDKIREKFVPLLETCKKHHTALRIGVNHGSLSERILEKYGDTPAGMVVSAMEYLRICREENFHDIVLSMKSSNTRVMVYAYRMLVAAMIQEEEVYPLHLGITEAGEGLYARIKSGTGIGALLLDGIGDTIRVSLTEPPEHEIPAARSILSAMEYPGDQHRYPTSFTGLFDFTAPQLNDNLRKETGTHHVVIATIPDRDHRTTVNADEADLWFQPKNNTSAGGVMLTLPKTEKKQEGGFPLLQYEPGVNIPENQLHFIEADHEFLEKIPINAASVLVYRIQEDDFPGMVRSGLIRMRNSYPATPIVLRITVSGPFTSDKAVSVATKTGSFFLDGLCEGIWLDLEDPTHAEDPVEVSLDILQATRSRYTKPEYISCPSCGRTLFDIEKVSARIREQTSHLKGLKIGIMGCIVNGPGEMADADYGYVGSAPHKITLYKNRKVVKRNISAYQAVDELIRLIKENGDWIEP